MRWSWLTAFVVILHRGRMKERQTNRIDHTTFALAEVKYTSLESIAMIQQIYLRLAAWITVGVSGRSTPVDRQLISIDLFQQRRLPVLCNRNLYFATYNIAAQIHRYTTIMTTMMTIMTTSSSAVADRPCIASCLSVSSILQYIQHEKWHVITDAVNSFFGYNFLLLATSVTDLQLCTNKFCSVLFVSRPCWLW